MLDPHGFVATCNSVNFFIVREGAVWAPRPVYLMPGITRRNVMGLCQAAGLALVERDFALTQVWGQGGGGGGAAGGGGSWVCVWLGWGGGAMGQLLLHRLYSMSAATVVNVLQLCHPPVVDRQCAPASGLDGMVEVSWSSRVACLWLVSPVRCVSPALTRSDRAPVCNPVDRCTARTRRSPQAHSLACFQWWKWTGA